MTPKERVLQVLRGHEASRIRFRVPSVGITINRATFLTVAHAIEIGHIGVVPTTHFDHNVAAKYDSGAAPGAPSGQLFTSPILGREQEGLILHECTHGFFDLKKTDITAENEEAICYVVDALYFRMTGLNRSRWAKPPHSTARLVADELLKQYAAGTHGVPEVNTIWWHTVRVAVILTPPYFDKPPGFLAQVLGIGPNSYINDG
jgi:hypothetical protein